MVFVGDGDVMPSFVERADVECDRRLANRCKSSAATSSVGSTSLAWARSRHRRASGNSAKTSSRSLGRVACLLTHVHVLDSQPPPETAVVPRIGDRVGMDDDRVDPRRNPTQRGHEPRLFLDEPFRWGMDADEEERKSRRAVEVTQQAGKLVGGDRRQLDRDAGPCRRFVDKADPVIPVLLHESGGTPQRDVLRERRCDGHWELRSHVM